MRQRAQSLARASKRTCGQAACRPSPPHPHAPSTCLLRLGAAATTARAAGCQHGRGGVAPGGLRGKEVAAAAVSPVLAVTGRRTGTRRHSRPTRAAPATGLLTRPAAASVTPGRRGPAVCSGAGRRGFLGGAPGGGAGGEFAAPRLLPPARALHGSPEGRCLWEDARLRPLGSAPPGFDSKQAP